MNLRDHLTKSLSQPRSSQESRRSRARFAPSQTFGRHFGKPAWDAKPAAVLVLFYEDNDSICIPFTVRPKTLRTHGGQVSFPGGMQEANETSEQAALREFREELGCSTEHIQILGRLSSLYVYNSNFHVTPWVAWANEGLKFVPNPSEVETVFSVPVNELARLENHSSFTIVRGAVSFQAPSIDWLGFRIWGATSVILGEVLAILDELN